MLRTGTTRWVAVGLTGLAGEAHPESGEGGGGLPRGDETGADVDGATAAAVEAVAADAVVAAAAAAAAAGACGDRYCW